jgi:uncharacterized protein
VLAGVVFGLAAWVVIATEAALARILTRERPREALWLRPSLYAFAAAALSVSTAFWTFSGAKARVSSYAHWGPYALIAVAAASVWLVARLALAAPRALERGARWPIAAGTASIVASGGLLALDLEAFPALYAPLHTALELIAAVLIMCVASIALGAWTASSPTAQRAVRAVAAIALGWSALFVAWPAPRRWVDLTLRHVWLEPEYIGRMLRRVEIAEAYLKDPRGWRGLSVARVQELKERFDLSTTSLAPEWKKPFSEAPALRDAIARLRANAPGYNVLVYYVDTLRQDAAADPSVMPHVVNFARHAIDFRQAYSCGSDTLRVLPGLTGGRYTLDGTPDSTDLLEVARRAGMQRVLAIPESAREFLEKLRPSFKFDETLEVPDYAPGRTDVWGYGADQPTARPLVDQTLGWLKAHKSERFFLWVFNFDQHNWRELNAPYVYGVAKKYKVPDQGELNWRYRVVATGIDSQFQRLLDGLARLGLSQRTIVLFVADHGEALGREGFWVHSVFLWEGLVRVPLILRVPALKPAVVDARVSLIDVAPTLARYMQEAPDMSEYQGEDLVGYLVPGRPLRRLPLLMMASSQDKLVRIGILPRRAPWKLVLPLESGAPELYDLRNADPDAFTVADQQPQTTLRLLGTLVRSPLFPRVRSEPAPRPPAAAVLAHSPQ